MEYKKYLLHEELAVKRLVTFHFKELARHYISNGERHDFWEFVYVDSGVMEIYTDTNSFELCQGDIVFYKPDEFHAGKAKDNTTPNLIVMSFECDASCMQFFEGKSFRLNEEEREILSKLIKEGTKAFNPPVDSPNMSFPAKRSEAPFGSEQIIKNFLEILLITLIRKGDNRADQARMPTITGIKMDSELAEKIIEYMKKHISANITIEELCTKFAISRTRLINLFKIKTGYGVKEYFNKLKIDQAKQIIREKQYNFSEIAESLAYSSVYYFSKQFKKMTDMTPTAYARSVKARYE